MRITVADWTPTDPEERIGLEGLIITASRGTQQVGVNVVTGKQGILLMSGPDTDGERLAWCGWSSVDEDGRQLHSDIGPVMSKKDLSTALKSLPKVIAKGLEQGSVMQARKITWWMPSTERIDDSITWNISLGFSPAAVPHPLSHLLADAAHRSTFWHASWWALLIVIVPACFGMLVASAFAVRDRPYLRRGSQESLLGSTRSERASSNERRSGQGAQHESHFDRSEDAQSGRRQDEEAPSPIPFYSTLSDILIPLPPPVLPLPEE